MCRSRRAEPAPEQRLLSTTIMLIALVALPWLSGFRADAVADHPTRAVAGALAEWGAPAEDCVAAAYGGLAVDRGDTRVVRG